MAQVLLIIRVKEIFPLLPHYERIIVKHFNIPALVLSATVLCSCQSDQQENTKELIVSDAQIVLSPVSGRPAAAYFILESKGINTVLTDVEVPGAERVMLHETISEDGVTRMNSANAFPIKSGQTLTFSPGGKHAMIFGLKDVKSQQQVIMTLRFDNGETLTVDAATKSIGNAANGG